MDAVRPINYFYVHCSDTRPSQDIGAEEIREWHMRDRGWSDIGYHYVIRRDGTLESGRDLDNDGDVDEEIGAHVFGHNADSIGVCLVGGSGGDFNFTFKQLDCLRELVAYYRIRYPGIEVLGHRDAPGVMKQCPNFDVRSLFDG